MNYEWAIAGKLEQPIAKISLQKFLGDVHLIKLMTKIPFSIELLGEGKGFLDNYKIFKYTANVKIDSPFYTVDYSSENYHGIAVTFKNKVIGLTQENYTFVEPEHRGKNIGCELLAEFHVAYPIHAQCRTKFNGIRLYTNSGLKSLIKAYNLMIERGALLGA